MSCQEPYLVSKNQGKEENDFLYVQISQACYRRFCFDAKADFLFIFYLITYNI